jgi:Immunity protein Imm1
MNTSFQDLQNDNNPRNGQVFSERATVASLLEDLRKIEPPFMCQFTGDNGFNLMIGVARDFGCVQHSSNDGQPPFLMAVSNAGASGRHDMEFLVGDTPTPIDGRYRIAFDELRDIVAEFVATGEKSTRASWEELG